MNQSSRTEIYQSVVGYLRQKIANENECVSGSTRLYHDLGLMGDDAHEFIEFLVDNYKFTDECFPYHDYFYDEYFGPLHWIKMIFQLEDRSKKELTVDEIVDMCEYCGLKLRGLR